MSKSLKINSGEGDDQGAKVRIAFSRERDDRDRVERTDGEWKLLPVMDQMTPGKPPEFANNGDSDASPDNTPSQFLLLRGLEPTVTEDLLAKGAAKLYKSSGGSPPPTAATSKKPTAKVASTTSDSNLGAKEGSLKRVLLVRDRKSGENWRYGFAEFAGVEDAQAALTKFNSLEKFTIASKPVNASYVHAGVFVPMLNYSPEYEQYTFSPLTNPAIKLAYWDEEAYVSELVVSRDTPETIDNPSINSRVAADKAAAAAEKEGLLKPGKAMEVKAKKRKAEIDAIATSKKAVPAHLEFWRNRHAELHGGVAEGVEDNTSSQTAALSKKKSKTQTKDEASPPSQSFADLERKCCYLCSRQFKTESEVNKHERLSQLHRDNLKNEDFKTKALAKIAKAGAAAEDTPEYRDRARERRAAFKQPKKPTPGSSKSTTGPAAITEEEAAEEPIAPSKGAALLGKMGWAAGEGLGAKGTGMVAPIATEMYIQGVGLGAQGGKVGDAVDEAARLTKGGYGGFLERTRDRAKERFEGMG
ncbi:MAG: hypothetical protein M1827_007431 [Pycnora praestabilis]|nr:MAG: hypothetical protein M1827_007431 [Pycnora praestabilis]